MEVQITRSCLLPRYHDVEKCLTAFIEVQPKADAEAETALMAFQALGMDLEKVFDRLEAAVVQLPGLFRHVQAITAYYLERVHLPFEGFVGTVTKPRSSVTLRTVKLKVLTYVGSPAGPDQGGHPPLPKLPPHHPRRPLPPGQIQPQVDSSAPQH